MAGLAWSAEEECLTIWYASIGIAQTTIAHLLYGKGFCRTMIAVRLKISDLRKTYSLGNASSRLQSAQVDRWIDGLILEPSASKLLRPTLRDQEIVSWVCRMNDLQFRKYKKADAV